MKRRQFIKNSLITLGCGVALSGCKKDDNPVQGVLSTKDTPADIDIIPQQTGTYNFSVPLPFDYKTIDDIAKLNRKLKKSKVTTFFNNIPLPFSEYFNGWVQIARGEMNGIKSLNDFMGYVKYAKKKGFKFVYIMNSPKGFSERDFSTFRDNFFQVLDLLLINGCNEIKVANTQIASLINKHRPGKFVLVSSCAFEYHNISQYEHLLDIYPNIKTFNVSNDDVHNFTFLRKLKEKFPNVKLELMVNEPCFKGCPARISCFSAPHYEAYPCSEVKKMHGLELSFLKAGLIYPWQLEYYSALGINDFKFTAHPLSRGEFTDLKYLKNYLEMIDNGIDKYSAKDFFDDTFGAFYAFPFYINEAKNIKLSEVVPYLIDIRHFVKHGYKCATNCNVQCKYCYELAKKLKTFLEQANA